MSAKTLVIESVMRSPQSGRDDVLLLKSGVNLIVGEKDTGKTAWLRMLDYLMGDDSTPEEALGDNLALKYDTILAMFVIGTERLTVERRWKESGARSKVFVDGNSIHQSEFSRFLLRKLDIPVTHFPKGNPFAEHAWPELSWRMLYRHIYRQERFWTDFADRQPPVEQAACLVQFLGAAEAVYPAAYGELVRKQKELEKLQAEKEAYSVLLHSITTELLQQKEISVAVTHEAVGAAVQRLHQEAAEISRKRDEILAKVQRKIVVDTDGRYEQRRASLVRLESERDELLRINERVQLRITEISRYRDTVAAERDRLERTKAGATVLADFKVTQCPVCDQEVTPTTASAGNCYLCGRGCPSERNAEGVLRRLKFEEERLASELDELSELIDKLNAETNTQTERLRGLQSDIDRVKAELSPARQLVAAMIPPDLGIMDQESGRIQEKLEQLQRVSKALESQQALSKRIVEIQAVESRLQGEIGQNAPAPNLGELGDLIQDRMNQYLNKISEEDSARWPHEPITCVLSKKDFTAKVKGRRWNTQIGATSQALVLFAYHYALLSLVADSQYNYPGLVIIDFPVQLADGTSIGEAENYLVKPFIELCGRADMEKTQFIAAGRAFENLPGTHQIHLHA